MYVINTSMFVMGVFYTLKPFLPKRTHEKLVFVGKDPVKIRDALLKDLSIENIPKRYGGLNGIEF